MTASRTAKSKFKKRVLESFESDETKDMGKIQRVIDWLYVIEETERRRITDLYQYKNFTFANEWAEEILNEKKAYDHRKLYPETVEKAEQSKIGTNEDESEQQQIMIPTYILKEVAILAEKHGVKKKEKLLFCILDSVYKNWNEYERNIMKMFYSNEY